MSFLTPPFTSEQFPSIIPGTEPNLLPSIIAVTGLAGHAFGSWRSREGPEMWLRDFLPDDLERNGCNARILTYGYDTKLVGSVSDAGIFEISKQFLEAVKISRPRTEVNYPRTDNDTGEANDTVAPYPADRFYWTQPWWIGDKAGWLRYQC